MNKIAVDEWGAVTPAVKLPQLERIGQEGVNIQCINSSDFVIGKQTNFNGPVTIVSCADVLKQIVQKEKEEKLIIRDPVLSQSAAKQMQILAEEKQKPNEDGQKSKSHSLSQMMKKLTKVTITVPVRVCLAVLLTSAISLAVYYGAMRTGEESPKECFPVSNSTCLYSQKFLSTSEPLKSLDAPASYVVIYQTHDEFCYDIDECKKVSKKYTSDEKKTEKVPCNFLVGGEGNLYEGHEWGKRNSSESPTDVLHICLMGSFTLDVPTYPQITATRMLIQFGVDSGFISKNYVLAASNATSPNNCLQSIYKIIKKWPNFQENPFESPL